MRRRPAPLASVTVTGAVPLLSSSCFFSSLGPSGFFLLPSSSAAAARNHLHLHRNLPLPARVLLLQLSAVYWGEGLHLPPLARSAAR